MSKKTIEFGHPRVIGRKHTVATDGLGHRIPHTTIRIDIPHPAMGVIDRMLDTGMFGTNREALVTEMLLGKLREWAWSELLEPLEK